MNKSILVAVLLAVALTACGKKEEPKAAAPAPAAAPQAGMAAPQAGMEAAKPAEQAGMAGAAAPQAGMAGKESTAIEAANQASWHGSQEVILRVSAKAGLRLRFFVDRQASWHQSKPAS